ncbi:MAG: FCD domain-containing protein [Armatimonadota bacterium]|nr:FCD domain-containing protein [Armatimonadota bacterium]MDR7438046.1 FCD domain-containing protein [Armatimonadota bacterium]MDR7471813.1 FCD domain-containing protein [Armatimonadota bacterium]MDR7506217.1 FCD domain-containing protein [Armatimonadota bacterium]MDR7508189.1 FCD domain-containing protein [Armatimonadota bacterium]
MAEQILEAIRTGVYRLGDRLPPERVLADQMGVSRPSVREALSALQLVGVVDSRAGDGTYVTGLPEGAGYKALSWLEESDSPVEALEARRVLERAVAAWAAGRATDRALQEVRRALDGMREAAVRASFEEFNAANAVFHLAIARATGNSLLERAVRPLVEIMGQQLAVALRARDYTPDSTFFATACRAHEEIYAALADRDAPRAAAAMDAHFDMIEDALKRE